MATEAPDLGFSFQDLSNLLATKDSAEVADKHQDCGLFTPATPKDDCVAVTIKYSDFGERIDASTTRLKLCGHVPPQGVSTV